jgi:ABC-type Fe3+/spermidine/putrescine transport system ATPase subunit
MTSVDGTVLPAIDVDHLQVSYGSQQVLHGVSLSIASGEFVAILGSSGCGKTTLLRTIAGFQKASGGSIRLSGRDVVNVPPEKRGMAMMFQSYALWPHMTVLGNVGYGLRLRGVPKDEIRTRVASVLKMLNLSGLENRKVTALSGGQRQRVALGRALAIEPQILLLDEPLSNLDAKVRIQLRSEIKSLQNHLGFTALHVTHDREEAMTMADRIVVMEAGRIAQVWTPKEVYDQPTSPFVASFMGAENTIRLDVRPNGSGVQIRADDGSTASCIEPVPIGAVTAYFRDDVASLEDPAARIDGSIVLPGRITQRTYPGGYYRYVVAIGDRHFSVTDNRYHELDRPVGLRLPVASLHLFPTEQTKGGLHA